MLDAAAVHAVALTEAAVIINFNLGHKEQRDAFRTCGGIRQLCQHQMNHVLSQVVITASDEDFGAGDFVRAISLWLGLGANHTEIGTRMALSQTHGARPLAAVHVWQVFFFQLVAGMTINSQCRTGSQRQVQAHRDVGGVKHFLEQQHQHFRHILAAVIRLARQASPAPFCQLFKGFRITLGSSDNTFIPLHAFFVAALTQWRDQVLVDLGAFFKNSVRQFAVNFFRAGQALPELLSLKNFVQDKLHITQRRFIFGHVEFSTMYRDMGRFP